MLGTDYLFRLERYLDDQASDNSTLIDELNVALEAIYELPSYQSYLNEKAKYVDYFKLPPAFGSNISELSKRLLDRFLLINGSALEVRIDKHNGRLHLTDGPWIPAAYRVYPFSDESSLICKYVNEKGYDTTADLLIDPACGCGHHGLAMSTIKHRANLDINLRSLAFCRINSILSHTPQTLCGLNDLRAGMPDILGRLSSKETLITINMPFAIFPKGGTLPLTLAQDGGDRGIGLTLAALNAVAALGRSAPLMDGIRLVLLFYSLGKQGKDEWKWEVVEEAAKIFPGRPIEHTIFSDEKMWRVNGVKSEPNPMPLDRLIKKADCGQTYKDTERDAAAEGYIDLENHYRRNGFSHLGYGLIDILVK